jgi:hypothetical protein
MTEPITERDLVIAAGVEILGAASLIDRAERIWRDDPDAARNALREARERIGAIIEDRNFSRLEQVFRRARDVFERLERAEKRLAKAHTTLARVDLQRELMDLQSALKRIDQCEDEDALEALLNEIERRATRVRDRAQDRDALWNALLILGKIRRFRANRAKRAASTSATVRKHYPGGHPHDQKKHGNWARLGPHLADPVEFFRIFAKPVLENRDLNDAEKREVLDLFKRETQAILRVIEPLFPMRSEWSGALEELREFPEFTIAAKVVTCVIAIDIGRMAGWRANPNRRGEPTLILLHELLHTFTNRNGYRQSKYWEEGLVEDVSRSLLSYVLKKLQAPADWANVRAPRKEEYNRAWLAMKFLRETAGIDPIEWFSRLARFSPRERRAQVELILTQRGKMRDPVLREKIRRALDLLDHPNAEGELP